MHLHPFGAFFEALAALNLVFTSSEDFLGGLNNQILGFIGTFFRWFRKYLNNYINDAHKLNQSLKDVSDESKGYNPYVYSEILKRDYESLLISQTASNIIEEKHKNFIYSFKAIFFISGLFCLFVLAAEGYNQFCCAKNEDGMMMPMCLFFTAIGVLIVSFFLFLLSFIPKKKEEHGYNGFWIGTFFVAVAFISHILEKHFGESVQKWLGWDARAIISLPVFVAISPFIIHIIRVLFHKVMFVWMKFSILLKMLICVHLLDLNFYVYSNKLATNWQEQILQKHKYHFWKGIEKQISTKVTTDLSTRRYHILLKLHERIQRPAYSTNRFIRSLQKRNFWW